MLIKSTINILIGIDARWNQYFFVKSNQSIQFNNDGVFAGDANLTYNNVTGALSATSFTGNGAGISYIAGANVFGEVANANYAHYALVTLNSQQSNTTTTVIGNYQPNINQVGNLFNLTVTGALVANSSLIVGGDATIVGNLIVEGNAIYADVQTIRIEDPIMQLAACNVMATLQAIFVVLVLVMMGLP